MTVDCMCTVFRNVRWIYHHLSPLIIINDSIKCAIERLSRCGKGGDKIMQYIPHIYLDEACVCFGVYCN